MERFLFEARGGSMVVVRCVSGREGNGKVPALRLRLLGHFSVTWEGRPVRSFESGKARALLCYLVMEKRPLHREHLAGLFWGELSERRARGNLSRVLTNLRKLAPGYLLSDRYTVQFDTSHLYWLDVAAFENHYRIVARDWVADTAFDDLTAAAELYRGGFLEAFYLRGCPIFEEWVMIQREQLRGMALRVLDELIARHLRRGEFALGIGYARRSLVIEPWREGTYRQMMLLLALQGERDQALRQYETCCRILDRDLNVAPTVRTQELYRRILNGEVRADQVGMIPPGMLSSDDRWLLNFAVVIGWPFTLSLLARVSGRSEEALGEVLKTWEMCHLLYRNDAGEYAFTHDTVRESLYRQLPSDLRKLLHGRVGQVLVDALATTGQVLRGDSIEIPRDVAAQVVYHFERSLDPHRALPYRVKLSGSRSY